MHLIQVELLSSGSVFLPSLRVTHVAIELVEAEFPDGVGPLAAVARRCDSGWLLFLRKTRL